MRIVPGASELTKPYWDAAREHRLIAQHCRACDALQHPPLPRCLRCHSADLEWRELGGRGAVYAYTIVVHPTHFAFADKVPYAVGIVELDEGVRILSDFPGVHPEKVAIGMRVRVEYEDVDDELTLPHFVPDEG